MKLCTQFSWNCMKEWTKRRFELIVTSYAPNKNLDDEIKKKARQVLKYNSKNWMKHFEVFYLTSTSIEHCQPKHVQNHLKKLRNKQSNKLNKNIIIAKNLKLLPLRQNLIPLNIPFSKMCSKSIFVSEIAEVLCLQGLKKFN